MTLSDLKRFLIGKPFPTSMDIHERLDKFRALAVFASDPISSNAYATEAIMSVLIVLGINHWRQKREGDEFVYLEQVEGPDAAELPEHAKFAVFPETPLAPETPGLLTQAEGALAIGDYDAAAEALGAMDEAELARPETRRVRIALAKATVIRSSSHALGSCRTVALPDSKMVRLVRQKLSTKPSRASMTERCVFRSRAFKLFCFKSSIYNCLFVLFGELL